MVDTENRLKLGCTLSPASLIVSPWTITWSMTVALISSNISTLCLPLPLCPPLPLTCPPPLPPRRPPRTRTRPRPLTLFLQSILRPSPSHLQQTVCSQNCLILVVSHHLTSSEIYFEWLCLINDRGSLLVWDCCHLCLPVWMTCALECRMCFETENVFRVLLKSLSEICKLCCTMWNSLRYWQQTAQLATWV